MSASRLFNSDSTVTLTANTATNLLTHKPTQIGLVGYFAGQGTFSVNVQVSDDGGSTWYTVKVVDSAATTTAKGGTSGYVNIAELNINPPGYCRLRLIDTSGSQNIVKYSVSAIDF
jgi:Neuraminidase (sialidase)